jgi:hypothetical protein
MRRGFTHAGGKNRIVVGIQAIEVCLRCDATVRLDYQSDAISSREAALDRYRALRRAGWLATISQPGNGITVLCPVHALEDGHGEG